jgi:hypothetical protein
MWIPLIIMLLIRQEIFHFKVVIKQSLLLYVFPNTTVLSVTVSITLDDTWLPVQILLTIIQAFHFLNFEVKIWAHQVQCRSLNLFSKVLTLLHCYFFFVYVESIILFQVLHLH